jgi:hypothetical protein
MRTTRVDGGLATLAHGQHGVVGRGQLRALGLEVTGIDSRVRRGALIPIHRGVYAVGHARLTAHGRWMGAVLAAGRGAALSHRSAAGFWRLLPPPSSAPEVTSPRSRRPRPDLHCHRSLLPPDEVESVDGIPVTSPSRTLFDLAAIVAGRQLERALSEVDVLGLTSRVSLPQMLGRYPRRRGSTRLRTLLEAGGPGGVTLSELEERFVAFLDRHGLPRPRLNADLGLRGRFFKIDCLWDEERLAVELDGRGAHGHARAFERDRERDRILLAEGWRVARVTWRQLHEEGDALASDLGRMLAVGAASADALPLPA